MGRLFVSGPKNGTVYITSGDDEIVFEISVPPGVYTTAQFEKLRGPGQRVVFDRQVVRQRGNAVTCKPEGQYESAANPHFRMTAAARQAREMRQMLQRTVALEARTRKNLAAIRRSAAVPQIEDQTGEDDAGEVSAT